MVVHRISVLLSISFLVLFAGFWQAKAEQSESELQVTDEQAAPTQENQNQSPVITRDDASQAATRVEAIPPAQVSNIGSASNARPNIENRGAMMAFVDGVVRAYMAKDDIAGATVSVVHNGRKIYSQGYGIMNADKTPVDPATTMFRVGSISKTFIWTAMMQLQAEGKLNINDPANQYLPADFQIGSDDFEEPIRIRHLMTHTPGYEDIALGHLFARTLDDVMPLEEYLRRYIPDQVRAPGESTSYSNYASGVAGLIVARVSGEPDFETYVEKNITGPLAMNHSTFREATENRTGLPAAMAENLQQDLSKTFERKSGAWNNTDMEFITPIGPAGAFSSTADDMARYMLAHLNLGVLDGRRILSRAAAEEMQTTLFRNAEGMNGWAHGFLEYTVPGSYFTYGHGGATLYFMSNMIMVPELNLGIFISTNTSSGGSLVYSLPNLFIERFFAPDTPETPAPPANFATLGQIYAGVYISDRHSYSLIEKIGLIADNGTTVSVNEDGYLLTSGGGSTTRWVEIGPNLFREVDGYRHLSFGTNEDGDIVKLFPDRGVAASTKTGFFGRGQWFQIIMGLTMIMGIGCTTGAWLRRKRPVHESLNESVSSRLSAAQGFLWLSFIVAFAVAAMKIMSMGNEVVFEFPPQSVVVALWIALAASIVNILALPGLYIVWRDGNWPFFRKIRHTTAILIGFAMFMTLLDWNMIGFHYY